MYLIIAILSISIVTALNQYPTCEDLQQINQNCTMITPYLDQCTIYNYTIYNTTNASRSKIVEESTLLLLNNSIYYLNFTQPEGSYIIKLCDGTTREIKVTEEDSGKMIIAALILVPLLFGFLLLFGAWSMSEAHGVLKTFLFMLSTLTFWVSLHFGLTALIKFYDFPEMQELISTTTYWSTWIFVAILCYFAIYMIWIVFHQMAENDKEKLEY